MIRHLNRPAFVYAIILMTIFLVACSTTGTTGGTSGGNTPGISTGTLELSLIDSPNPYQAIYVTINEVRVHHDVDGWQTLSNLDLDLPQTINLLELVNGAMAYLGSTELAAGHYSQMRFILEDSDAMPQNAGLNILDNPHPYFNYLIDAWDSEIPLKVPSGGNSGIKLVSGFDIVAENATELVLDFDALKSVVQAGKSGKWLLKPTIKVVETVTNKVSGIITDTADDMEIEGAMVTAQENNLQPVPTDAADLVNVAAGTASDEFGEYFMYLPLLALDETPYNIVVTMAGYETACRPLPSNETKAYTADFALTSLAAEQTNTLSASVEGLATAEDSALFSIRKDYSECGIVEVASFSVVNSMDPETERIYSDPVILADGDYQVVVSAEGLQTQVLDLKVEAGEDRLLDVAF